MVKMSVRASLMTVSRLLAEAAKEVLDAQTERDAAQANYEGQKRNTLAFAQDVDTLRTECARWRDAAIALGHCGYLTDATANRPALEFARVVGQTMAEMRDNVRLTQLYGIGDAQLVWVNQGDLLLMQSSGAAVDRTAPHATPNAGDDQ